MRRGQVAYREEEEDEYDEDEDGSDDAGPEPNHADERYVQLRVRYALHVPRVDLLSESDPYVVLSLPGCLQKPRTVTIDVRRERGMHGGEEGFTHSMRLCTPCIHASVHGKLQMLCELCRVRI